MKKILPPILISVALGVALLLSKKGSPSRESLLPLSRAVAEQEKGVDRAVGAAFPLSTEEERKIGEGIDRTLVSSSSPTASARELTQIFQADGAAAAASPLVQRFRGRYAFRAVPSGSLNAFAVPGGFVYATEPLLQKLGTDTDAMLFVVGHEIGHIELGHCADAYRLRAGDRDPITGMLGGLLSVGRIFAEIHFSSTQELEADAFAVNLVKSLKRDPRGALRVFDALGLKADGDTKRDPGAVIVEGVGGYFQTHPGAWERRAAIERMTGGGR